MTWPSLRHKLWPISVLRWPVPIYRIDLRDWYFGPWLRISLGRWFVQVGHGTYGDQR
jgi:hypothetical protein